MYSVLIIEQDGPVLDMLERAFTIREFHSTIASRNQRGLNLLLKEDFDLIFLGLSVPEFENREMLHKLIRRKLSSPCIIIAGPDQEEDALVAVEEGAYDYIGPEATMNKVRIIASRALQFSQSDNETKALRALMYDNYSMKGVIGSSPAIVMAKNMLEQASSSRVNVVIQGERGTGKRRIARTIHFEAPPVRRPFVEVSCALEPENLVEIEFFGRELGFFDSNKRIQAGKLEKADGGTLYLEDIDRLHPKLQSELLGVLKTGEIKRIGGSLTRHIHIRAIASSTKDLNALAAEGKFNRELLAHIGSINMKLPPLRQRRDDIPQLISYFIEEAAEKAGKPPPHMDPPAMSLMLAYGWPGNLDELMEITNAIVRLNYSGLITPMELPERIRLAGTKAPEQGSMELTAMLASLALPPEGISLKTTVEDIEKSLILKALDRAGGIKKKAAEILGIKRTTLIEKIKSKNIPC